MTARFISVPTIHLNGTARVTLEEDYGHAVMALRTALRAVQQCAPHPRDYYVQQQPIDGSLHGVRASGMDEALAQHLARLRRIQDTIDEIDHIRRSIQE